MNRKENEIENLILTRLRNNLADKTFELVSQDKWQTSILKRWIDIVIYKSGHPFVVIEVKYSLSKKSTLAIATDQVRSYLSITNARIGIVTDNETFYIYDRNEKELDFVYITFEELIIRITNVKPIKITKQRKNEILEIIKSSANNHLNENLEIINFLNKKNTIDKIKYDSLKNAYYFNDRVKSTKSFENQFFNKIFGEFGETQVCRYTTLDTLFSMLNFVSFRMNGLVGMNDKSEVNYVDNYLNGVEKPLIKMHHNTIIALNKRYITSCSTIRRKDELTLWRLYAEDGTGVCLVFDVKQANLSDKVLIQKVKYADKDGKHPELEFLKEIRQEVESLTGFTFEFRNIGIWKHFFKPFDYSIEEEVRLLVIDDGILKPLSSNWVKTFTHSIINPFVDFRLNSKYFPVQLIEVILGPKTPEQDSNLVQLQEMIRRKRKEIANKKYDSNIKKLKIALSNIKHYR